MSKTINLMNKTLLMKKAYETHYFEPLTAERGNDIDNTTEPHGTGVTVPSFSWGQILEGSVVFALLLMVFNLVVVTNKLVVVLNAQKDSAAFLMNDHNDKVAALNAKLKGLSDHLRESNGDLESLSIDQKILEVSTEQVKALSNVLLREYNTLDAKLKTN